MDTWTLIYFVESRFCLLLNKSLAIPLGHSVEPSLNWRVLAMHIVYPNKRYIPESAISALMLVEFRAR